MADTPIRVHVEAKPSAQKLERYIRSIGGNLDKGRAQVNRELSVMLDQWVQRNFRSQGGQVGGWADLKRGYRVKRGRGGKTYRQTDYKILQDTGALRRSFKPEFNENEAKIGSALPYSGKHELGDPARKLPQRRMLPRAPEIERDIFRVYDRHIKRLERDARRGLR